MSKTAAERRKILPTAKKIHSSITEWGWMNENDENFEGDKAELVKKKFKHVKVFLYLTGLYYSEEPKTLFGKVFQVLKEVMAVFAVSIVAISKLYTLITAKKYDEETLPQICLLNYLWQSLFSIIFLIYWQRRGYLKILFTEVCWPNISEKYSKSRKEINCTVIGCCIALIVTITFPITMTLLFDSKKIEGVRADPQQFTIFGSFWLFSAIVTYAGLVYHIILFFYIIVSKTVYYELKTFNDELIKVCEESFGKINTELLQLGNDFEISNEEFEDKFIKLYLTHGKLGAMVLALDNFFEVYTFVLIGLNIPLTIFTILNTFVSFHSTLDAIISSPLIFFCLGELIGLTLVPAKLHQAILCVEAIINSSTRIWYPYNEKVYQIANSFISHVKQSNLGISIWGFAMLTKPTILTTISITFTYLAVLIELKTNSTRLSNGSSNVTTTCIC